MIRTLTTTTSALAKVARLGMIAVAAVLVAGSITTSVARPSTRSFLPSSTSQEAGTTSVGHESALQVVQSPAGPPSAWLASGGTWISSPSATTVETAGGMVPILARFDGLAAGHAYTLGVRYRSCDTSGARPIETLGSSPAIGEGTLEFPGPGRARPDATIAIPADHARAAAAPAYVSLWGGTFTSSARGTLGSDSCAADAILELPVRAHGESVAVLVGGYLAQNSQPNSAVAPVTAFIAPTP